MRGLGVRVPWSARLGHENQGGFLNMRKVTSIVLVLMLSLATAQNAVSAPLHAGYESLGTPSVQLASLPSIVSGVSSDVSVKFLASDSPNFDFQGTIARECVETCVNGTHSGAGMFGVSYGSKVVKTGEVVVLPGGYSPRDGSMTVLDPFNFKINRSKSGTYKYQFTFIYQIKPALETPTTDTAYGWHWLYFQDFTVQIQTQKLEATTTAYPRSSYSVNTKLSCDKSTGSSTKCSVLASATLGEDGQTQLSGPLTINICTFSNAYAGYVEDCQNTDGFQSVESKSLIVSAGVPKSFQVKNLLSSVAKGSVFIVIASPESFTSGDVRGYVGFQSSNLTKILKKLSVSFSVPQEVIYGKTYSFKISTSPSINGSCELFRYSWKYGNPYYSVGTANLASGKASGKLTWLWDKNGSASIPMSIMAVCKNNSYSGSSTQILTGFVN